jgi:hypothetical protein
MSRDALSYRSASRSRVGRSGVPAAPSAKGLNVGMASSLDLRDQQALLDAMNSALEDLVKRDEELLRYQAHELAHVHRFAVYLEGHLRSQLVNGDVTVDLDYDRDGQFAKVMHVDPPLPPKAGEDGTVRFRPDLIIHRRGEDGPNVLVLEWKKEAGRSDIALLQQRIVRIRQTFDYALGVIVNSYDDRVEWCIVEDEKNLVWCVIRCPDVDDGASVADVR